MYHNVMYKKFNSIFLLIIFSLISFIFLIIYGYYGMFISIAFGSIILIAMDKKGMIDFEWMVKRG